MVVRGWDACGLLAPYKPELAQQCIDKANAAMVDTEHPFYPLFPSNDRTQPPPGGEEPTPGPCEVGVDGPSAGDAEEQQSGERADAIICRGRPRRTSHRGQASATRRWQALPDLC